MKLLLLLALAAIECAAQPIAWGPSSNGLRLGINVDSVAHPTQLRMLFENTGTDRFDLLVGGMTGKGPIYHGQFQGIAPDGKEIQVLCLAGPGFVAGFLAPIIEHLAPGASYELLLPLNKFVYVKNRQDITLDVLLRDGFKIRAFMEVTEDGARWGRMTLPWIGKVTSADYGLPH